MRGAVRPLSPWMLTVVAAAVVVFLFAAGAASAFADTLAVDFETGPALHSASTPGTPVNDEYLASSFVRFKKDDAWFRPYRRDVGAKARSGSVVADVSASVCYLDTGDSFGCEGSGAGTYGRLARTASSVTLYAGLFSAQPNTGAQLTAYRANGSVAATGTVVAVNANNSNPAGPINPGPGGGTVAGLTAKSGRAEGRANLSTVFKTPVTVTSAAGDIASFRLDAVDMVNGGSMTGADLGFDDLTFDFPAGSLPDVSLSNQSLAAVLNGQTTDVPISITRINGSTGPIQLTATGLPAGVTAQITPNPVVGTAETATLKLTASANVPRLDNPAQITITADPLANANVAPAARTTTVGLRIASPFTLTAPATTVKIGTCTSTDIPFVLGRDITTTSTVSLRTGALVPGMSVEILPGTSIAPGGGLNVNGTLRVTAAAATTIPTSFELFAESPGLPTRQLQFAVNRAPLESNLTGPANLKTPQYMNPGTTATVTGNGFCPGTMVHVGNGDASGTAPVTIAPDGKSLTFVTPRGATTGNLDVIPPSSTLGQPTTAGTVTVDQFRNVFGLPFANPSFGWLSYTELGDAFGYSDFWVTVNPCWPWGSCSVPTGIPDPTAYLAWGVINIAMKASGGHCFGISRAVDRFRLGKESRTRFRAGATQTIDIGLNAELESYLDGQHATQASKEFLTAWAHRDRSVKAQLQVLEGQLHLNRTPIVSVKQGFSGHAMVAYDLQYVPGGADVYLYDNNRPAPLEGNAAGVDASVLHVTNDDHKWTFNLGTQTWSGGDDGSLFVIPQTTIPDDPTLPGLGLLDDVPAMIFGSGDGAAAVTATDDKTEFMPVLDPTGTPGTAGFVVADGKSTPFETTITGSKAGTYSASVLGQGFAGAVNDVTTKPGVTDVTGGSGTGRELSFSSGVDRPLSISLATSSGVGAGQGAPAGRASTSSGSNRTAAAARAVAATTSYTATISTKADQGGSDVAGLAKTGTLDYQHDGDATSVSFTITRIAPNGGPVLFESGPVKIAGGDQLTAAPKGADLALVALTVKSKNGKTKKVGLPNRAKAPAGFKLSGLKLVKTGKTTSRTATVTAAVSRLGSEQQAALGLVFKLKRGAKVVARSATSNPAVVNGAKPITWTIPASAKKGRFTLTIEARLAVGGTKAGAVTAKNSATVTLR